MLKRRHAHLTRQQDTLTVNYSQMSVVAIGAIQELKADNDPKQRQIDALRDHATTRDAEIAELNAHLAAIEAALSQLSKIK